MTFYEIFCSVCKERNISPSAAAHKAGLDKSIVSYWKKNPETIPKYENLSRISKVLSVSTDYLLGHELESVNAPSKSVSLSTWGDIADLLYQLVETEGLGFDIEIKDHIIQTDNPYVRVTVYFNDPENEQNSTLCNLLRNIDRNYSSFSHYAISRERYELEKARTKEFYSFHPVSQKVFEDIPDKERVARYHEFLEKEAEEIKTQKEKSSRRDSED